MRNNNNHKSYKDEDTASLLDDKEECQQSTIKRPLLNTRSKWTCLAIGLCVFLLVLMAITFPSRASHLTAILSAPKTITIEHRFLHTVLPTSTVTLDLCKAVLSSAILGYPMPWLIGWEKNETDTRRIAHEGALLKMTTVQQWLNGLPQNHNTDIIAVLGNPSAIFQARPEVLLKRYFGTRARVDERLQQTFTTDLIQAQKMQTEIIFSTEKECPPSRPDGIECEEFPAEDGSIHFLSSNLVMGEVGMMQELWNTAVERAEQHIKLYETFDENFIFSRILRDQELQREAVRKLDKGGKQTQSIGDMGKEFGIGLDFSRELSYATDARLEGVSWVKHNDSKEAPVPKDIAASMRPFWTTSNTGVPSNRTWRDVPLLTGVKANIVPAIIHQGPEASEDIHKTWWEKLWFHPYARELLNSFALTPEVPVAILRDATGAETRWWSPHVDKAGVMTSDVKFHEWNDICGSQEDAAELFMDDEGVWKDPRLFSTHYFPQDS